MYEIYIVGWFMNITKLSVVLLEPSVLQLTLNSVDTSVPELWAAINKQKSLINNLFAFY